MDDAEVCSPQKGKKKVMNAATKSSSHFRWSIDMESVLLQLLIKEEQLGNRVGGTFTSTAYTNVATELRLAFQSKVSKNHIKNKLRLLKSNFSEFKDAFRGMSGFSWNWETKKFEAEDIVWKALLQENPKAASLKEKSMYHWDAMNRLYGQSQASGAHASGANERAKQLMGQKINSMQEMPTRMSDSSMYSVNAGNMPSNSEGQTGDSDHVTPTAMNSMPGESSIKARQKRKQTVEQILEKGYNTIAESMKDVSKAMVQSAEIMAQFRCTNERTQKIFTELQLLDLEEDKLLFCYEYLSDHYAATSKFLGLLTQLKKKMLVNIKRSAGLDP